jgi:hypothetical protein
MSPDAKVWQPLVSGTLAERARASVDEILAELTARGLEREDPWTALLYEYADRARGCDAHAATTQAILEASVASLGERAAAPWLYGGFTGVAWLASHITARSTRRCRRCSSAPRTTCPTISSAAWWASVSTSSTDCRRAGRRRARGCASS